MTPDEVPDGPLLVDTDAFSFVHYRKGRWSEFEQLLAGHDLAISFASIGELRAGAIKNNWGTRRLADQERFFRSYTVIRPDSRVVERYAELHARLHNQLKMGGVNDMWVAACALTYGMPIVTNNLSDYGLIGTIATDLVIVHPDI